MRDKCKHRPGSVKNYRYWSKINLSNALSYLMLGSLREAAACYRWALCDACKADERFRGRNRWLNRWLLTD